MSTLKNEPDALHLIKTYLEKARAESGYSDFGSLDFQEPLEVLVKAVLNEASLEPGGRELFDESMVHLLKNRLRLQNIWNSKPDIDQIPLPKPLYILSLPRCGSTMMFNLMSQDSRARSFQLWELMSPAPEHIAAREAISQERIEYAERSVVRGALAGIFKFHHMGIFSPEECNRLLTSTFKTFQFSSWFEIPSYWRWLAAQDRTDAYLYYKKCLQTLLWQRPCPSNGHLLLKSPTESMINILYLLKIMPNASFVYITRRHSEVLASTCAMSRVQRLVRKHGHNQGETSFDSEKLGQSVLTGFGGTLVQFQKNLQQMDAAARSRVLHIEYSDLVDNPIKVVRSVYERLDYQFSDSFESNMKSWLAQNQRHKFGKPRYSLEEFGLSEETVRQWENNIASMIATN